MNMPKKIASADDIKLAQQYLGKHQQSKEHQELKEMLNTAARAGAGGTKPGLFGIRPQGMKRASDIVDFFTPGKLTKPDRPFEKPLPEPDHKLEDSPFKLVIMLPRNFCPDCNRKDRPADENSGGAINVAYWAEDRADLGVQALDAMISFFCQECCLKYRADIKDSGKSIELVTPQGVTTTRQQAQAERLIRIRETTENYIKAMRLANRWEIYTDGRQD